MLSKKIKYIILGVGVLAIAVGIYAYKEYNRKPTDLADKEAVDKVPASAIINAYSLNEDDANKKYLGKIIEVSGAVVELSNQQDTAVTILMGDSTTSSRVSCTIDKKHIAAAKKCSIGKVVNVRGICTGYLMDVELNRCLIIE